MTDLLHCADVAIRIALAAGELIKDGRENQPLETSFKGGIELVTQMDLASEQLIIAELSRAFPDHKFLAEETANDVSATDFQSPTWIVDPIDGTVNYAHHHHQVGVSIALAIKGKMKVGVVHNPFSGETFHAVAGSGAFLNKQPIQGSIKSNMKQNLVATGFPYAKTNVTQLTNRLKEVLTHCADIRRLGSAAMDLCWVACGRIDSYYERDLQLWDMAAGWLIAQEAGCLCGHIQNNEQEFNAFHPSDVLVSGNSELYRGLQGILQHADSL